MPQEQQWWEKLISKEQDNAPQKTDILPDPKQLPSQVFKEDEKIPEEGFITVMSSEDYKVKPDVVEEKEEKKLSIEQIGELYKTESNYNGSAYEAGVEFLNKKPTFISELSYEEIKNIFPLLDENAKEYVYRLDPNYKKVTLAELGKLIKSEGKYSELSDFEAGRRLILEKPKFKDYLTTPEVIGREARTYVKPFEMVGWVPSGMLLDEELGKYLLGEKTQNTASTEDIKRGFIQGAKSGAKSVAAGTLYEVADYIDPNGNLWDEIDYTLIPDEYLNETGDDFRGSLKKWKENYYKLSASAKASEEYIDKTSENLREATNQLKEINLKKVQAEKQIQNKVYEGSDESYQKLLSDYENKAKEVQFLEKEIYDEATKLLKYQATANTFNNIVALAENQLSVGLSDIVTSPFGTVRRAFKGADITDKAMRLIRNSGNVGEYVRGMRDGRTGAITDFAKDVREKSEKIFEGIGRGEGAWYNIGNIGVQTTPILGLVAAAAVTKNPKLAETAGTLLAGILTTSTKGAAKQEYDQYVKENNIPIDINQRNNIAFANGVIEMATEMIPIGRLSKVIPKDQMKMFNRFLAKQMVKESFEEGGSKLVNNIVTDFAKKNPTAFGVFKKALTSYAKTGNEEALSEVIAEMSQTYLNDIIKNPEDKTQLEEYLKSAWDIYYATLLTGGFAGAVQNVNVSQIQKERRDKTGKVILASDQNSGEVFEVVGQDGDKIIGYTADGRLKEVSPESIDESLEMSVDDFNSYLQNYKNGEADIEKEYVTLKAKSEKSKLERMVDAIEHQDGGIVELELSSGETVYLKNGDIDDKDLSIVTYAYNPLTDEMVPVSKGEIVRASQYTKEDVLNTGLAEIENSLQVEMDQIENNKIQLDKEPKLSLQDRVTVEGVPGIVKQIDNDGVVVEFDADTPGEIGQEKRVPFEMISTETVDITPDKQAKIEGIKISDEDALAAIAEADEPSDMSDIDITESSEDVKAAYNEKFGKKYYIDGKQVSKKQMLRRLMMADKKKDPSKLEGIEIAYDDEVQSLLTNIKQQFDPELQGSQEQIQKKEITEPTPEEEAFLSEHEEEFGKEHTDRMRELIATGSTIEEAHNIVQEEDKRKETAIKLLDAMKKNPEMSLDEIANNERNKEAVIRQHLDDIIFNTIQKTNVIIGKNPQDVVGQMIKSGVPKNVVDAYLTEVNTFGQVIPAFYDTDTDTMIVISENIKSLDDLNKLFIHEVGVHKGIRLLIPDRLQREDLFRKVSQDIGESKLKEILTPSVFETIKKRYPDPDVVLGEEYMAYLAEKIVKGEKLTNIEINIWQRIVKAINDALNRVMKIGYKISDYDIAEIINTSVESIYAEREKRSQADILYAEYLEEIENNDYNELPEWQRDLIDQKKLYFKTNDFSRYKDPNELRQGLIKSWLRKDGVNMDTWVQEFMPEMDEKEAIESLVDFIVSNPSRHIRKTSDRMNEIKREYKELTGESINNYQPFKPISESFDLPFKRDANIARIDKQIDDKKEQLRKLSAELIKKKKQLESRKTTQGQLFDKQTQPQAVQMDMFAQKLDLSKENVEQIIAPIKNNIKRAEIELRLLEKQRDTAENEIRGQGTLFKREEGGDNIKYYKTTSLSTNSIYYKFYDNKNREATIRLSDHDSSIFRKSADLDLPINTPLEDIIDQGKSIINSKEPVLSVFKGDEVAGKIIEDVIPGSYGKKIYFKNNPNSYRLDYFEDEYKVKVHENTREQEKTIRKYKELLKQLENKGLYVDNIFSKEDESIILPKINKNNYPVIVFRDNFKTKTQPYEDKSQKDKGRIYYISKDKNQKKRFNEYEYDHITSYIDYLIDKNVIEPLSEPIEMPPKYIEPEFNKKIRLKNEEIENIRKEINRKTSGMFKQHGWDVFVEKFSDKYDIKEIKTLLDKKNKLLNELYELGNQKRSKENNQLFKREELPEGKVSTNSIKELAKKMIIDRTLAVDQFQKQIEKKGGSIPDWMNAHQKMQLYRSRVMAKQQVFDKKYRKPFIDILYTITKQLQGSKQQQIDEIGMYMMAKHAPERNKYFREVKVTELREEYKEEKAKLNEKRKDMTDEAFNMSQDKLNKKYEKKIADVQKDTKESVYAGMTDEEAKKIVSEFENKIKNKDQIKELWKTINDINSHTLEQEYRYGLMSKDIYDSIINRGWKYYVPLKGWQETDVAKNKSWLSYIPGINKLTKNEIDTDKFDFIGQSHGYNSGIIKRAKGRISISENPISHMFADADKTIIRGEKNEYKRAIGMIIANNKDVAKEYASYNLVYLEPVINEDGEVTYEERTSPPANKQEAESLLSKGKGDIKRLHKGVTPAQEKETEVMFYNNGQKYVIKFKDPSISRAINGVSDIALMDDLNSVLAATLGKPTRFFSAVMTSKNPGFIGANLSRDFATGLITAFAEGKGLKGFVSGAQFAKNFALAGNTVRRGVSGKLRDKNEMDRIYKEFLEQGGRTGFMNLKSPDRKLKDVRKELRRMNQYNLDPRKATRLLNDLIEGMATWSEDMTRYTAYYTARKKGMSIPESLMKAKNVSVNFDRKGQITTALNSYFAFFNAAIQGVYKAYDITKKHPGKMTTVFSVYFIMGFLQAMMNDYEDDDGDRMLDKYSDWQIKNNWILPGLPDIPLPQIFRWFNGLGVDAYKVFMRDQELAKEPGEAIWDGLREMPTDMSPIEVTRMFDPKQTKERRFTFIFPTISQPIVDVVTNQTFSGRSVYPEPYTKAQEEIESPAGRYYENVPRWAKGITDFVFTLGGGDTDVYSTKKVKDGKVVDISPWFQYSPEAIEHIALSYLGGAGKSAIRTTNLIRDVLKKTKEVAQGKDFKEAVKEIDPENIIILRRFMIKPYVNATKERFYNKLKAAKGIDAHAKYLKRKGFVGEAEELKQTQEYKDAIEIIEINNKIKEMKEEGKTDKEITEFIKQQL